MTQRVISPCLQQSEEQFHPSTSHAPSLSLTPSPPFPHSLIHPSYHHLHFLTSSSLTPSHPRTVLPHPHILTPSPPHPHRPPLLSHSHTFTPIPSHPHTILPHTLSPLLSHTLPPSHPSQYMEEALHSGENMEFFIEGSRSRSGKPSLPPKAGLLSVLVDSVKEGKWHGCLNSIHFCTHVLASILTFSAWFTFFTYFCGM